MPNDSASERPLLDFTCPFYGCRMGPDAYIYSALVSAPDGRERLVWACVEHLSTEVDRALSGIRLEPFE